MPNIFMIECVSVRERKNENKGTLLKIILSCFLWVWGGSVGMISLKVKIWVTGWEFHQGCSSPAGTAVGSPYTLPKVKEINNSVPLKPITEKMLLQMYPLFSYVCLLNN